MDHFVYIFAGVFETRESACAYTEEQWEREPGAEFSDEEYAAWEERNPTWLLRAELGVYLDSDFIETIWGEGRYEYLGTILTEPNAVKSISALTGTDDNTMVLIFDEALGDFAAKMPSTSKLRYCGKFACQL